MNRSAKKWPELDQQIIEERELRALKESNDPAYQDLKEEIETYALRNEVDTTEDEALAVEHHELVAMLEHKLESLLHKEK